MLDVLKVVGRVMALNGDWDREKAEALAGQCAEEFCLICNLREAPSEALPVVVRMVEHAYAQLNGAGLASQSFSGASETYLTDYPEDLRRSIHRFRRIGTI